MKVTRPSGGGRTMRGPRGGLYHIGPTGKRVSGPAPTASSGSPRGVKADTHESLMREIAAASKKGMGSAKRVKFQDRIAAANRKGHVSNDQAEVLHSLMNRRIMWPGGMNEY